MKRGEVFESKYLAAHDLGGKEHAVTVEYVAKEEMSDGTPKAVVYWVGHGKGTVMNVTNWNIIEMVSGSDDTDNWPGTEVTLYESTATYQGQTKPCIRIKPTPAKLRKGFKTDDSATAGSDPAEDAPPF